MYEGVKEHETARTVEQNLVFCKVALTNLNCPSVTFFVTDDGMEQVGRGRGKPYLETRLLDQSEQWRVPYWRVRIPEGAIFSGIRKSNGGRFLISRHDGKGSKKCMEFYISRFVSLTVKCI